MSRIPGVVVSIVLLQLCLLIVVGAAVAAYLYAERKPEVYGGRVEILYEGQDVSLATEAERQIATQRALLESSSTLGPVAERFALDADDLDKDVSVESVGDSNVIRVTVGNDDPRVAVDVAQAVAETYVAGIIRPESPELEEAKSLIRGRIEELTAQLAELQQGIGTRKTEEERRSNVEKSQALAEVESLLGRIGSLQDRLTELEVQQLTASGARILTPSYLLDDPLEPQPMRAGAGGAIAGLFIACLTLLVVGRLRKPS
jgi:uncharacterized protein involved in exopolysaccharide biosynthesis